MKWKRIFTIAGGFMVFALLSGCAGDQGPSPKEQRARATRNLGEAYMAEGNYTKALGELLKAEKMTPDDPYVHNDLGLTYLAKNNPEKAVGHFEKAVELNPDYSAARNNLGSAYVELKKWDKAIECFEKVSKDLLYMTPHYPLSNLGYVYYMKGEYQKAEQYYRKALEMKRDFPKALHGLGQVYLATGDLKKAIKKLEQAVEKAPQAAPFYMDLGRAYTENYQYNKALQVYKKAAAIAEDTDLADKAEAAAERVMEKY
ncbi:MAG: tetratricopeptide repeat protein [Desulfobacteraceae bacterium]|nr:tetratricopeptide repeat protein [Desulfobacteraceae bacterium]MCF8096033.1 tetratricopeptide repeat protein [Desulfobacteraceae bacterium]